METKVSEIIAIEICSMLHFTNLERSNPIGFRGGIWVLWNEATIELDITSLTQQAIHAITKVRNQYQIWFFSAIYTCPNTEERRTSGMILAYLLIITLLLGLGDFNDMLLSIDKFWGRPLCQSRIHEFPSCLDIAN